MVLETCFLIDLYREIQRERPGAATRFLDTQPATTWILPHPVWMEFAGGFPDDQQSVCDAFLEGFSLLPLTRELCWTASRIDRSLRSAGAPIGDHDLWIAAAAVLLRQPLVSRNVKHFARVRGMAVIAY